ncbi:hypothetical protein GE061_003204 [Apolygus lucorum]|uniref:PI3K/PI4K catalytic domain-containing protein n=1 Tax=Apolygus lucorum TaxID=248454 RepID=A0A8S9X390_APOLU|nr:hypothetical protein GE061_003204 [Apolygus lucorum]
MLGDPGENLPASGKDRKSDAAQGSSKENFPSLVVSRGRSEPRSKGGKKKEERRPGFADDRGYEDGSGATRRGNGRRGPRKDRDEFGGKGRHGKESTKYEGTREFNSRSEFGQTFVGLPEDSRISTILRKLAREEDERKFTILIKNLQDALALSDNAAYIRRSLDMILDSLYEVICNGPNQQCKVLAAKSLGHVGFALDKECKKYIDWIYNKYKIESKENAKKLLTTGIQELVLLDAKDQKLSEHSQSLMKCVGEIMESTECGDIFITAVELTLSLIHRYPELIPTHFHDTVDVLLGWHFEPSQPKSVTECAGRALTVLAPYWVQDLQFTYSLLNDFLDDIFTTKGQLASECDKSDKSTDKEAKEDGSSDKSAPLQSEEVVHRITSILNVVASVMKNLEKHLSPVIPPPLSVEFLNDCLEKVIKYVTETSELVPECCCKLVGAGNKCAKYIVAILGNNVQKAEVLMEFLYMQFRLVDSSTTFNATHFSLIAKIVSCVDESVTTGFVDVLLCPESIVLKARLDSYCGKIELIYRSLLKNKNVHVLIRSYAHIIGDLDAALRSLKADLPPLREFGDDNPHLLTVYPEEEVQEIILFILRAFKELAVDRNPATPLFTLKPTLFEVLALRMPIVVEACSYPRLHLAYLKLLRDHCITHDYFTEAVHMMEFAASQTQTLAEALGVPTLIEPPCLSKRHYLSTIIDLLNQNLATRLEALNKIMLVEWTHEILVMCFENGESFHESQELQEIISNFCFASADSRPRIAIVCVPVLKYIAFNKLIAPTHLNEENSLIVRLIDLCFYYLNSIDDKVRQEFHLLMSALPAVILAFVTKSHSYMSSCSIVQLKSINYEDMISTQGVVDSNVFRAFMNYIFHGITSGSPPFKWMTDLMSRNYSSTELNHEHYVEVRDSLGCIMEWLAFQAAKHCIDNRLRTVYGKALGTFTAIEDTIRVLAKETVSNRNLTDTPATCRRARLLIQFIEQFEKLLYNAVEGTASAFPPASKQSKIFFATNRASCFEWFHRIRLALLVVALHSGMSPWAVRHGYCLLQNLVDSKATHSPEFEAALLNTGLALTTMGERDAVAGLHLWARDIAQSSHSELKPLIDMASRSYESAADKYEDMVADIGASNAVPRSKQNGVVDKSKNMEYTVKSFLADQLTECYLALNSWEELASWKKREGEFLANENGECSRKYGYVTANFADAMSKFDAGDLNGAAELLTWDEEETESLFPSNRPSWDVANLMDEADFVLKNIIIKKCGNSYYTLKSLSKCGNAQTLAENVMEDIIKDSSSEVLSKACSLKFVAQAMINRGSTLVPEPYIREVWWKQYVSSPDMERCAWWAVALDKSKKPVANNESLKVFLIEVIKASRKAGNLRYTTKCLLNYLEHAPGINVCPGDLAEEYMMLPVEPSQAPALHQLTKLLRSTCDTATSVRLSTHISAGLFPLEEEHHQMLNSAVLRNLSTIFAAEKGHFENLMSGQLNEVVATGIKKVSDNNLQAFTALCDSQNNEHVIPLPKEDTIVGKILLASVGAHINSLKSWEALAAWCYEMGGKVCSQIWVKNPEEYGGQETLKVISSYHSVGVDVDRASSESLEDQIRDLGIHTLEQIDSYTTAWKRDNARVYSFFKVAIHSYFKFLNISPYQENNCKFVTATLRLLRLMVKHASELQETVDADLAETPVHPWVPIVPQLLARLNHADPYVRKKVEELLVKIGLEAPHLILFPAVVGSGAMPTTKLFPMMKTYENKKDGQANEDGDEDMDDEDEDDRDDDDEMRSTNERAEMMENSFHSILDSLSEKYAEEIAQVKMFVSELQRITLLWDELWLGALLQHQGDINRRFSSLQSEIKTTEGNTHLDQIIKDSIIREKYRLILKPILFIFEQLNEITSVQPETAREKQFQELYTETIQNILTKLREPTEPINPNDVWETIQGLQHALQDKSRHRGGAILSMSDLSTTLSKLDSTKIFMPGVRGQLAPPTIEKIENNVAILPTKTKPKKLVFSGSNGENYTYLFKGLEDLHLDERIMQFLSIANSMLKEPHLQAHHYSVVPLGPRSGLISWVENVTPIFSLYKKWQQREASKNPDETICRTVMRPSELFASKLAPVLMEHNIPIVDQNQRHKWPVAALRKCLQELMSITPTYLLYKELWSHSVNAFHWWRTLKTYSSSLAVMSMIGYIIGLGDRHLDNVLVNLKTGEVVHIDYNVCFEKGKTLRVPEKVPFRLTPNLRAALGVTGVEQPGAYAIEKFNEAMEIGDGPSIHRTFGIMQSKADRMIALDEDITERITEGTTSMTNEEMNEELKDIEMAHSCVIDVRIQYDLYIQSTEQKNQNGQCLAIRPLFDKLETQLRALESLGLSSNKFAAMLKPLVESALPEEILRAWERSRAHLRIEEDHPNREGEELEALLRFLRAEVEAGSSGYWSSGSRRGREEEPE